MAWTSEDYKRLGQQVRAARRQAGLGREQLAQEARITSRTLADVETGTLGKRKRFSVDTYIGIEGVLGWPLGTCEGILDGRLAAPEPGRSAEPVDPVIQAIRDADLTRSEKSDLESHYWRLVEAREEVRGA